MHKVFVHDGCEEIMVKDMMIGDFGRIIKSDKLSRDYWGLIIMRAYNGLVCLSNPETTWSRPESTPFKVSLFPKGTKIIIEI